MSRILVVDDEPVVLSMLELLLDLEGHEVIVAENGTRALDLASTQHPDLLLLDVMMPDLDGFSVAEELRRGDQTREIPIIFVTAKAGHTDQWEGWAAGAESYVTKPFDNGHLLEEIQRVLDNRTSLRNQRSRVRDPDRVIKLPTDDAEDS